MAPALGTHDNASVGVVINTRETVPTVMPLHSGPEKNAHEQFHGPCTIPSWLVRLEAPWKCTCIRASQARPFALAVLRLPLCCVHCGPVLITKALQSDESKEDTTQRYGCSVCQE